MTLKSLQELEEGTSHVWLRDEPRVEGLVVKVDLEQNRIQVEFEHDDELYWHNASELRDTSPFDLD